MQAYEGADELSVNSVVHLVAIASRSPEADSDAMDEEEGATRLVSRCWVHTCAKLQPQFSALVCCKMCWFSRGMAGRPVGR